MDKQQSDAPRPTDDNQEQWTIAMHFNRENDNWQAAMIIALLMNDRQRTLVINSQNTTHPTTINANKRLSKSSP